MTTLSLPHIPGHRVVAALEKVGFVKKRQSGSHVVMRHSVDLQKRAVVPLHGSKSVKPGTMRSILKGTGLSIEEFIKLI